VVGGCQPETGGTGGSATGGTSPTGGASTGGAATGGSTSGPSALNCTDPVYGAVSIPATAIVSDFENNSLYEYVQDGRGVNADPWHAYAVEDVNDANGEMQTPSIYNPKHANNNFRVDTTQHGPCSTKGRATRLFSRQGR